MKIIQVIKIEGSLHNNSIIMWGLGDDGCVYLWDEENANSPRWSKYADNKFLE